MPPRDYDLLVLGSGPAGQRGAIQAAKLGKRVAVIEKKAVLGGTCINTGTIPSKTLREAVLHLSGYRERGFYGASYTVKERITVEDLLSRTETVIRHELDVIRHQLARNRVELLSGNAAFTGPHSVQLTPLTGRGAREITAERILIATGTHATADSRIAMDGKSVFICDDIMKLDSLPRTLTIMGAGVIGAEYASIFATLGVRVTLIDKRNRLLPFLDSEIVDALTYHLRQNRVTLRLGEEVVSAEVLGDDTAAKVKITLASGKTIVNDKALYSVGRAGATDSLNLAAAGLSAHDRGKLKVNEHYQTDVPHIYAAGDVIGFPSLASVSMEQGRLAACHAFGEPAKSVPALFPYGIYTIPEISLVGKTEEELTAEGVPYEIGKAHYREIARGQIMGDQTGLLKLIFHAESHELLSVHIIGEGSSELVHIGQAVLSFGGKLDYFLNTVFNYPTLAEAYKTAAFDGYNRIHRWSRPPAG